MPDEVAKVEAWHSGREMGQRWIRQHPQATLADIAAKEQEIRYHIWQAPAWFQHQWVQGFLYACEQKEEASDERPTV